MKVLVWDSGSDSLEEFLELAQKHVDIDLFEDINDLVEDVLDDDLVVLDLDQDRKLAEKTVKRLKKSKVSFNLVYLCNDLDPKSLSKHQKSKLGGDVYLRSPMNEKVLLNLIGPLMGEIPGSDFYIRNSSEAGEPAREMPVLPQIPKAPAVKVLEEHQAPAEEDEAVAEINSKLNSVFSEALGEVPESNKVLEKIQEEESLELSGSPAEDSIESSSDENLKDKEPEMADDKKIELDEDSIEDLDLSGTSDVSDLELSSLDENEGLDLGESDGGELDLGEDSSADLAPALEDDGALELGDDMEGGLDLSDGAEDEGSLDLSEGAEDDGSLDLSGGAEDYGSLELSDGADDDGSLDLSGGAEDDGSLDLSDGAEDDGSLDLSDGAEDDGSLELSDGADDDGSLDLSGGADDDGSLDLSDGAEDDGSFELSGGAEDDGSLDLSDGSFELGEPEDNSIAFEDDTDDANITGEGEHDDSLDLSSLGLTDPCLTDPGRMDGDFNEGASLSDDELFNSGPESGDLNSESLPDSPDFSQAHSISGGKTGMSEDALRKLAEIEEMMRNDASGSGVDASADRTGDIDTSGLESSDASDDQGSEEMRFEQPVTEEAPGQDADLAAQLSAEEEEPDYDPTYDPGIEGEEDKTGIMENPLVNQGASYQEENEPSFSASNSFEAHVDSQTPATNATIKDQRDVLSRNDDEFLRLGETIKRLRQDREALLNTISDLEDRVGSEKRDFTALEAELEEKKIELALINRRRAKQMEEMSYRLELSEEKKLILEEKNKRLEKENEALRKKANVDVNKVRSRERELESKLDLLKSDTETQLKNRDLKILELKRKIDTLEFDIESIQLKEKKTVDSNYAKEERMERVINTLRRAIGELESEEAPQRNLDKIKKNLDV